MSDKTLTSFNVYGILVLGVFLLFPLTQVSDELVWEEDWSFPSDDWVLQGYSYDGGTGFQPDATADPSIIDGVFTTHAPTCFRILEWGGTQQFRCIWFMEF